MNRVLVAPALVLALAAPAAAKNVKVYVFMAAEGISDTFRGFTPAGLQASADDLGHAIVAASGTG
jgi:hypothetical protein